VIVTVAVAELRSPSFATKKNWSPPWKSGNGVYRTTLVSTALTVPKAGFPVIW
jgi:hypothetical protein